MIARTSEFSKQKHFSDFIQNNLCLHVFEFKNNHNPKSNVTKMSVSRWFLVPKFSNIVCSTFQLYPTGDHYFIVTYQLPIGGVGYTCHAHPNQTLPVVHSVGIRRIGCIPLAHCLLTCTNYQIIARYFRLK